MRAVAKGLTLPVALIVAGALGCKQPSSAMYSEHWDRCERVANHSTTLLGAAKGLTPRQRETLEKARKAATIGCRLIGLERADADCILALGATDSLTEPQPCRALHRGLNSWFFRRVTRGSGLSLVAPRPVGGNDPCGRAVGQLFRVINLGANLGPGEQDIQAAVGEMLITDCRRQGIDPGQLRCVLALESPGDVLFALSTCPAVKARPLGWIRSPLVGLRRELLVKKPALTHRCRGAIGHLYRLFRPRLQRRARLRLRQDMSFFEALEQCVAAGLSTIQLACIRGLISVADAQDRLTGCAADPANPPNWLRLRPLPTMPGLPFTGLAVGAATGIAKP